LTKIPLCDGISPPGVAGQSIMNVDDKVMELSEAIRRFVHDGDHVSIGGFTITRNPMALAYEIIRQGKKNLHVYVHSHGQAFDLLIGAGCTDAIELSYGGTARFSPGGGIRFKKAIEGGTIRFEDYTNFQMTLRFLGGAMGLPFMPIRSLRETDVFKKWGFDEEFRKKNARIPPKKIVPVDNPFARDGREEKIVLVPAINPDVTIIHVQQVDRQGTIRIKGLTYTDVEQAKAAKYLIVSCEELVETEAIRENPDQNQIPFFMVDAVVLVPYGAHPTACYGYYDYDPLHFNLYKEMAPDDGTFRQYLDEYVFGVKSHEEYLEKIGRDRLSRIRADPRLGYRPGLDRR
jgi:glutaconate CoA-transferase subunit A